MPVSMRKVPKISDQDARRISEIIRRNNKKMKLRKKYLREKLYKY